MRAGAAAGKALMTNCEIVTFTPAVRLLHDTDTRVRTVVTRPIAVWSTRLAAAGLLAASFACADITAPTFDSAPSPAPRASESAGTGDVYIMVQTDPDGAAGSFSYSHDFGTSSSPQVPSPFTLGDGQLKVFNSVAAGTYTVTQSPPAGWGLVASGDGYATECWDAEGASTIDIATGVATIHVTAGGFVVCTFVNAESTGEPPPDDPPPPPPDDPPAPGLDAPKGFGYWKQSLSCGKQRGSSSHSLAEPTLGALTTGVGDVGSLTCAQLNNLLAKTDLDGTSRANDGAYQLAAHLLLAKLNVAAGAPVPECVASAMAAAEQLLSEIEFTGMGEYLGPRSPAKAVRQSALALAELLDRYNNADPRVMAGNCG